MSKQRTRNISNINTRCFKSIGHFESSICVKKEYKLQTKHYGVHNSESIEKIKIKDISADPFKSTETNQSKKLHKMNLTTKKQLMAVLASTYNLSRCKNSQEIKENLNKRSYDYNSLVNSRLKMNEHLKLLDQKSEMTQKETKLIYNQGVTRFNWNRYKLKGYDEDQVRIDRNMRQFSLQKIHAIRHLKENELNVRKLNLNVIAGVSKPVFNPNGGKYNTDFYKLMDSIETKSKILNENITGHSVILNKLKALNTRITPITNDFT